MIRMLRTALPFALAATLTVAVPAASAQFYKLHNADVAVGGTGQFTTTLTSNGGNAQGPTQQFTTDSAGFLASFRDHPVGWAGVEFNYGYSHLSERYGYYQAADGLHQNVGVPTSMHEGTAAYMFHPHFFHLQPFVNIGGGAINFDPHHATYQWRGTGLVEAGLDIPTSNPHFGFRVQGRSLIYRAPNFYTPTIGSRSWVATSEPSVSAYIRF